jgi:hypothetical protein
MLLIACEHARSFSWYRLEWTIFFIRRKKQRAADRTLNALCCALHLDDTELIKGDSNRMLPDTCRRLQTPAECCRVLQTLADEGPPFCTTRDPSSLFATSDRQRSPRIYKQTAQSCVKPFSKSDGQQREETPSSTSCFSERVLNVWSCVPQGRSRRGEGRTKKKRSSSRYNLRPRAGLHRVEHEVRILSSK